MRATSRWKAWLDCGKAESAERVAKLIAERADLNVADMQITAYQKGGYVAAWRVTHDASSRDALVVDLIRKGQCVASGWTISGAVDEDFGGLVSKTSGSGQISIAGVTMLAWEIVSGS